MGGDATFSGTTYQARVIALVYTHVLAQMRLGWFSPADDTPVAVSGETEGPGDDAQVEFGAKLANAEIQAKHGLKGGAELRKVLERLHSKTPKGETIRVVLTVDRPRTTRWILNQLPGDIGRLRSGRKDGIKAETKNLLKELTDAGASEEAIQALYVVAVDVDSAHEPEAKQAYHLLQTVILEDPIQSAAAWSVLVDDAGTVCARKERRTRKQLVALLEGAHIKVKPPAKDDAWHRQLDFTKQLLNKQLPEAALAQLVDLDKQLTGVPNVDPFVFYRNATQRAAALSKLGRGGEALVSAKKALDYKPNGVEALRIASYAAILSGDLDAALTFAERAISEHPDDGSAWGARAHVAAARGEALPTPNTSVAESSDYRKALIEVALMKGDRGAVLELTSGFLRDGERSPTILFHRANSLIDTPSGTDGLSDAERYTEVERLATELIDALAGSSDTLAVKGLVLRSSARRLLGRTSEADEDLAAARELQEDDIDALALEAKIRIEADDLAGASELLRFPSVSEVPELLAVRARLAALTGRELDARRDIEAALAGAADSGNEDRVRFSAADVALLLKDIELAHRILDGVSVDGRTDVRHFSLSGRLSFAQGKVDEGATLYREAIDVRPDLKPELLAELGSQLLIADRPAEAVAVYSEIAPSEIPEDALRAYATALIAANALKPLQELLDRLASEGPLPAWALAAATDVALRQEDVDTAIAHLGTLVERPDARVGARIELARLLVEAGRVSDAIPHIDVVFRDSALSPVQRMQVAQLLHAVGRQDDALPLAHTAFSALPGDASINRAFIMLTFMGKVGAPTADAVDVDTYVRLTSENGEELEYTILPVEDVDPRRGEISVKDAEALGLMGKTVGEKITRKVGWQATEMVVEQILPVIVRDAQQAAFHYADNFPGEPFFIASFTVGDCSRVTDLAPIVASLESQKQAVDVAFELYREQGFPLGMIVKLLGGSISDVMEEITEGQVAIAPLLVEWPGRAEYEASRSVARSAETIVVTASALKTVGDLALLDILVDRYRLVAPRSLVEELRSEMAEASRLVADGHSVISRAGDGLQMVKLEPGHPTLISRKEAIRDQLDFLLRAPTIEPRPLERIAPGDSEAGSLRDIVGRSSYDALVLGQYLNLPVLADDLGLRRIAVEGAKPRSFSTVSLLEALADEGTIGSEVRDRYLATLVGRRYAFVMPTRELLSSALRRVREIGEEKLRAVIGTLGSPGIEPGDAARLTVQAVRSQLMATVQVMSPDRIVGMALGAMVTIWPPQLCSQIVARAASVEFALYPQASRDIQRVCTEFLADVIANPLPLK